MLGLAGIDCAIYTAHSTRAVSTSTASAAGMSISDIMTAAGWSQESTFVKYYKMNINENLGKRVMEEYYKTV